MDREMSRRFTGIACALAAGLWWASTTAAPAQSEPRLARIQARGVLGCGIEPDVPGFAERDPDGRYRGLDVDICRAVATAIFGTPEKVRFAPALSVAEFRRDENIDMVARRITWELRREGGEDLLFGPVTFYDGQGFLVPNTLDLLSARQLDRRRICVAGGTVFESNLNEYAARQSLNIQKDVLESPHDYAAIAAALAESRCGVYTGDVSDLGAIRSLLPHPNGFSIAAERISKEPLAPLVRREDTALFTIVRWTVFAVIAAEELSVTSANVDEMERSPRPDVQRLLGVIPGNGRALGLRESWARDVIKFLGNYGEIYERNLGTGSAIHLDRGMNRLFKDGGLMYAPPLR
jgi:general L-amino acid transport system substrate-binding protein